MGKAPGRMGTVLGGAYRLERLIGEGGMGSVYEASHTRLPRRFAVKLLNPDVMSNREVFERFQREAEIASSLGDEHIVQVVDFNYTEDGLPYMVLELLVGQDLAARIEDRGRLSLAETASVFEQTAGALELAHQSGIVHRDLKPQNLFLVRTRTRDDFVKILDFGISKVLHAPSLATKTGAVFGTPYYMSPEQAEGRQSDIDSRTDIFALGAIMYECLSGKRAFDANSLPSALYQVCHLDPPPLRGEAPEVPAAIEQVLAVAMAKRREQRYPDVRSFCDDFLRAAHGQATLAASQPPAPAQSPVSTSGQQRTVSMGSQPPASRPPTMPESRPPAAPTTMSGATGQSLPPDMTMAPRSRKGAVIAIVAMAAAVGVAAFVLATRGGKSARAGAPDAGPAAALAVDAAPVQVPPAIDAALAAVMVDAAPAASPTFDAAAVANPTPDAGRNKPDRGEPKKGFGIVQFSADPWAAIYVDGKFLANTPFNARLPAGKHRVEMRNDDTGKRLKYNVNVLADQTISSTKSMH